MDFSATDKKEVVLKYVKDLGYKARDISDATGLSIYTVNKMLTFDACSSDECELDLVIGFLENGVRSTPKTIACTGNGCDAMKGCIAEKDHLIEMQNDTIVMLREKIKRMNSGKV